MTNSWNLTDEETKRKKLEIMQFVNSLWDEYATERKKFRIIRDKTMRRLYIDVDYGSVIIPVIHKNAILTNPDDFSDIKKAALKVIETENKILCSADPEKHSLIIQEDHKTEIKIKRGSPNEWKISILEVLNTPATPTIESLIKI